MKDYQRKPIQVEILPDSMLFRLLNDEKVFGYTIPKGFTTDFASVPKMFWFLIPPMGKHNRAALLHDYLCWSNKKTRKETDRIFYTVLREHGVSTFRCKAMYYSVRLYAKIFISTYKKSYKNRKQNN